MNEHLLICSGRNKGNKFISLLLMKASIEIVMKIIKQVSFNLLISEEKFNTFPDEYSTAYYNPPPSLLKSKGKIFH